MASESKEVMLEEVAAAAPPPVVIARKGPPRFAKPVGVKISRGPLPSDFEERLESLVPAIAEPDGVERVVDRTGKPSRTERKETSMFETAEAQMEAERRQKEAGEAGVVVAKPLMALPESLQQLGDHVHEAEQHDKSSIRPPYYKLPTRRDFKQFVVQVFKDYRLPEPSEIIDPDACKKATDMTSKDVKTFNYQSFVRDFMQKASPYRGILVYHGLGSGKTCTSIASMETLFVNNQRPVYIMTPASLSANYKDEITKCGPYIFRTDNHWVWVPVPNPRTESPERKLLESVGIPASLVIRNKGAWLPDPKKVSNFVKLSRDQQTQIKAQIMAHIDNRFVFINYNGITKQVFKDMIACKDLKQDPANPGKTLLQRSFDGATIVIDEVHNLIRNINNSDLETIYKDEPRDLATYIPKMCAGGQSYRVSYTLYRMLCNAVGAKVIALSATPIINFPQEVAILANLLGGDIRMAHIACAGMDKKAELEAMLSKHPEVEYAKVSTNSASSSTIVDVTPVPSGFRKVQDPASGAFRGYVRSTRLAGVEGEIERERNIEGWALRVANDIRKITAVQDKDIRVRSTNRLPDIPKEFVDTFVDTENLVVKESTKNVLMGRLSGLISYYKGGKREYMAEEINHTVMLDMSENQYAKYTVQRVAEIKREKQQQKKTRYDRMKENVNSTFKIFSRAACNFAFPDGIDRPIPADEETWGALLTGEKQVTATAAESGAEAVVDSEEGAVEEVAQVADIARSPTVTSYTEALTTVVATMRARGSEFFSKEQLVNLSPKFQAVIDRLDSCKGPALVYSNFKTLEGVGLFGVALEVQKGYKKLDIVKSGAKWVLSPETLASGAATPRYIMYTGDEDREKRNILLAIFNGKWAKVPSELAESVRTKFGAENNIAGTIARVIMITQSGAEGISLANVRQVHIMEPYWNYVRLEQVKGRAVRICSHMDLPPEERNVDIFTYIMKFSDARIQSRTIDETLERMDDGKTTDQQIYELMTDKKKIADSILNVMQSSAVDCELNKGENGSVSCYTFAGAASNKPIFHPILKDDLETSAAEIQAVRR